MSRSELGVVWWTVVGKRMDDDMAGRPLTDCVIALLEWVMGRNQLLFLIEEILKERPDLSNP